MTKAYILHGLIGLACTLLAAGCGTIVLPGSTARPDPTAAVADPAADRRAEALAEYSMGVIAQEEGDSETAVEHYRRAVEFDPDNTDLKLDLAVGLIQLARYDELDALLDGLEESDPDNIRIYQLRVLALRLRGMNEEALVPLEKATRIDPAEPIHYIEQASILLRLGNGEEAAAVLEDALGPATNRLAIYHALGEVNLRLAGTKVAGNADRKLSPHALEILERGLEEFPDDLTLMNQYGDLLILHRRVEEAIDVFTRIEELSPDDEQLRQKLALSLISIGDRGRAILMLEEVAAKRPDNTGVWLYLSELHEGSGNTTRAIECLDHVIETRPDLPDGYIQKAYILLGAGRTDDAESLLIRGLKETSDDVRLTEMLAYVYMADDRYANAIVQFKRVEAELTARGGVPYLSNFYQNYAVANQMLGVIESAADILRKGHAGNPVIVTSYLELALRNRSDRERLVSTLDVMDLLQDITPNTPAVAMLHALVAFNAEDHARALKLFEKTERLATGEEDADLLTEQFYFWMGASAERQKLYDKAEEFFLDAISMKPDYAEAHNYLAYMHAERGVKLEMALDHVGVALAVEPDNAAYLDTRGWIYYQQGRFEEARVDIEEAIEIMPDDPTIADHLGDVHKALGNDEEAVNWWKKSLESDDTNESVRAKISESSPAVDPVQPDSVTPAE